MSRLARKTLEKVKEVDKRGAKSKDCHFLFSISAYVEAYTSPHPRVLATLQRSYKSGMETGDIEKAFRSWGVANICAFLAGVRLSQIYISSSKLLEQVLNYNVNAMYQIFSAFRFTLMHLIGNSETPLDWKTELNSKFMSGSGPSNLDPSETLVASRFYWGRIQLAYYFREIEIAAKMIKPLRALKKVDIVFVYTTVQFYFSGLVSVGLARKTGKKIHLVPAKKALREMKAIVKNNGANNFHRYLLMKAEIASCVSSDVHKTKLAYGEAISAASKAGFRQDAALGNELAAEYMLSHGDDFWPSHYFTAAHTFYTDWGALAKADHLMKLWRSFINPRFVQSLSTETKCLSSGEETAIHKCVNLEMLHGKKSLNELFALPKTEKAVANQI